MCTTLDPRVIAEYRRLRRDGYRAFNALDTARFRAFGSLPRETLTAESAMRYAARMIDGVPISAEFRPSEGFPMYVVRVDRASLSELVDMGVWLESNGRLYGEW